MPPTPDPVLRCVLPPEDVDGVCTDGDSGATGWTRCIGVPVADCGPGEGLVLGAGAVGVLIRGADAEEPLVLPLPPRCAIATLAANAKKPASTTVKASTRCIIDKRQPNAHRSQCADRLTPRAPLLRKPFSQQELLEAAGLLVEKPGAVVQLRD